MPPSSPPEGRRGLPISRPSRRQKGLTGPPSWPRRPPRLCGRPRSSPSAALLSASRSSQEFQRHPNSIRRCSTIFSLPNQPSFLTPSCSCSKTASPWQRTRSVGPYPIPPNRRPRTGHDPQLRMEEGAPCSRSSHPRLTSPLGSLRVPPPHSQKGHRHRARQACEALLRLLLLFPPHSLTPALFKNPRDYNELETLLSGPRHWPP